MLSALDDNELLVSETETVEGVAKKAWLLTYGSTFDFDSVCTVLRLGAQMVLGNQMTCVGLCCSLES